MDFLLLAVGAALLFGGGELLVRNASLLARAWGMTPMVIGLTVVAFGTSAPELAASLTAALTGSADIALGNVAGSNILNVAVILGLTAVIAPLRTRSAFLKREMPFMLGVSVLLVALAADGSIGRIDGAVLAVLLVAYLTVLLRGGGSDEILAAVEEEVDDAADPDAVPAWRAALGALVGLVVLVVGAQMLVEGAVTLAREIGVPELVIGATIVALGTSLPELVTSAIAATKGESDLALGNIVGSNVFNVLAIMGITSLVQPIDVPFREAAPDLAMMLGTSFLLWPFLFTGRRLGRREGGVLLATYAAYVAWRFFA